LLNPEVTGQCIDSSTGRAVIEEEEVMLFVGNLPGALGRGNRIENIREAGATKLSSERLYENAER
jgi:hypothetical protein